MFVSVADMQGEHNFKNLAERSSNPDDFLLFNLLIIC